MSTPVDWAQLRRATRREVKDREAEDIRVIDRWVASLPVALLPMDSPNVRMRLSTIVESQEYKKDSVILAAGRKSASRVYVVHTGTVHITAMNEVPERSMPEFEDAVATDSRLLVSMLSKHKPAKPPPPRDGPPPPEAAPEAV